MGRIYVASSWKNQLQPTVVSRLKQAGHEVYDFRNPPGNSGFAWREVDADYEPGEKITFERYVAILSHVRSIEGYNADIGALDACDICVAVLPFGKSAAWEFGYAKGRGKRCYLLWTGIEEPELMFSDTLIVRSIDDLVRALAAEPLPVAASVQGGAGGAGGAGAAEYRVQGGAAVYRVL